MGLRCRAWRKGYGYTGSFHFGQMRPIRHRYPGTVDRDQGDVMLNLWDCDRVLLGPDGSARLDSRVNRQETLLSLFDVLIDTHVSKAELDEATLTLRLMFADGHIVELIVDPGQVDQDDEQWAVESESGVAVGVFGLGSVRWTDGCDVE